MSCRHNVRQNHFGSPDHNSFERKVDRKFVHAYSFDQERKISVCTGDCCCQLYYIPLCTWQKVLGKFKGHFVANLWSLAAMEARWGYGWAIIRARTVLHTAARVPVGRSHCFYISCSSVLLLLTKALPLPSQSALFGRAAHDELTTDLLQWKGLAKPSCLNCL